jgi:hypothetical protein
VEELDLDVVEAVAARPVGGNAARSAGAAGGAGAARLKLSKKAARRAARRAGTPKPPKSPTKYKRTRGYPSPRRHTPADSRDLIPHL